MEKETKLKNPIELIVEPRISGGLVFAVAKIDDRVKSVRWDFKTKSWVFAKGLPIGTVLAAAAAPPSLLIAKGIPSVNISSNMGKEAKLIKPPPTLDLKNFTWKKFIKWLNYIWSEKIF